MADVSIIGKSIPNQSSPDTCRGAIYKRNLRAGPPLPTPTHADAAAAAAADAPTHRMGTWFARLLLHPCSAAVRRSARAIVQALLAVPFADTDGNGNVTR